MKRFSSCIRQGVIGLEGFRGAVVRNPGIQGGRARDGEPRCQITEESMGIGWRTIAYQ